MRRLRHSKRGAGDEAFETPPYLAIAAVLVLFTLGLAVNWFWMLFIEGPSMWDSYAIANFDRLGEEISTMLETGKWHEARVIPYGLYAEEGILKYKRRSIVGINPGMAPPESEGCRNEGEIKFNKVCKRYPCLCLCEATDCTDMKQCMVFKKRQYKTDVRFVGLEQEGFNTGKAISGITDWNDEPLHELVLYSRCNAFTGAGWGQEFDSTGNLYVEEMRSDDGQYTYLLIARADDVTEERQEKVKEIGREEECNDEGAVGTNTCYDLNCCGECKTHVITAEVYCECMPRGTKGGMETKCSELDCCDECEYDENEMFPECVRESYPVSSGGWERVCGGIENPVKGMDISYHQGDIDWDMVAADGIRFAFIRASVATVSSIHKDSQFSNNWPAAKANGIKRGAYHFFRSDKDAEAQAEMFLAQLGSDYGEIPPILDVEMDSVSPYPFSRNDWINGISIWTDIVESRTGMKPIIYTSWGFWAKINTDKFSDHTLWVAHWTDDECPRIPSAWDGWVFWQTCGGCESVNGITNRVDADLFNGNMEQLMAYVEQVRVI